MTPATPGSIAVAGLSGGVAMMPVGALLRALDHDVNEYGEAVLATLTGTTSAPAEPLLAIALHLVVSCLAAIPLAVALPARATTAQASTIGLAYGGGWWATINALALPWLYRRPTPYELGWADIWPSLLVHAIFGVVAAIVLARRARGLAVSRRFPGPPPHPR